MKNIPVRSIKSPDTVHDITESLKIRTIVEVLAGQDMVQHLHRHDFYFILALEKGHGQHEIDFVSHPVSNNSIFFVRPGQVHSLALKVTSEGYLMEFGKNFLHHDTNKHLLRKIANKSLFLLDVKGSNRLQTILHSIHEEYRNKKEGFREVIQASLSIFLIELARQRDHQESHADNRNDYAQERLQDFLDLLEKEISRHKQVSHYADRLNLSRFQLNSITKTLIGKSAADVIDDHIILESKRYLLGTSNQVNQIAYQLGYEDVSYFIRFFKKHTGHSPEVFRQNSR